MPPVKCRSCGRMTPEAVLCMYCGKHLEDQIACPKCSRKLVAGSKSCQYCGAELVKLPPPDVITCRKCGRKMAGHLEHCQVCGTPSPRGTIARPAPAPAAADPAAALNEAFERAIRMMETDRAAEALPTFDQLLSLPGVPERDILLVFKATALKRCGRVPEALQAVQQALQVSPESADGWSCAADCFLAAGDPAKAEKAADRALGCSDRNQVAWIVKGLCQKGAGRKAEALQCFERAVEVEPRSARGWSELGALSDELGRTERAAEAYGRQLLCRHVGLSPANLRAARRVLELHAANFHFPPGIGAALGELARDRLEIHRYDEAAPLLECALTFDPRNAEILALAGGALFAKPTLTPPEIRQAAEWITRALEIEPGHPLARKMAGLLEQGTGRKLGDLTSAKAAPATPRDAAVAESEKAQTLFNEGRQQEGLQAVDRALAADPTYPSAWYGKGSMLLRLGRYADAIPCYDQALALKAELPTALAERATCLANLGNFQEAIETADRSLALDKDKPDALLPRAGAYEQTGRLQEALRDYSRFLTLPMSARVRNRE